MNTPLKDLITLQALEFGEIPAANAEERIKALRAKIPGPILGHYDRLVDKGKKGVAELKHQVCTGCHMRVPLGTLLDLMGGAGIRLCDCCGRYLYLVETPPQETAQPVKKTTVKRVRKQTGHPVLGA